MRNPSRVTQFLVFVCHVPTTTIENIIVQSILARRPGEAGGKLPSRPRHRIEKPTPKFGVDFALGFARAELSALLSALRAGVALRVALGVALQGSVQIKLILACQL